MIIVQGTAQMTMKREGRVVWFAWFRFRGDPLMIVPGVLKGILQSLSSVLLWVLSLRPPSLFLCWLYIGMDPWLCLAGLSRVSQDVDTHDLKVFVFWWD